MTAPNAGGDEVGVDDGRGSVTASRAGEAGATWAGEQATSSAMSGMTSFTKPRDVFRRVGRFGDARQPPIPSQARHV